MASFTGKEMLNLGRIFAVLSAILQICSSHKFEYPYVTCGSVVKLMNVRQGIRLHSHDVKYGSGSGQQSVTGVETAEDNNSYWRIKGKMGVDCVRGSPVKCGNTIRFTHVNTGRNLHSHHFQSPLSHNLEVSAFGENGEGDEGDHWSVVCDTIHWERGERVRLRHVVTDSYLHVSGDTYGRPIHGQREISGYHNAAESNYWKTMEGIFIKPTESVLGSVPAHDEF